MNLYTLRSALLLPALMLCSLLVSQTCTVTNSTGSSPAGVAVWLISGPYAGDYVLSEPGAFTQDGSGNAQFTGTVESVGNPSATFDVNINYINGSTWAEWSAMGRGYKDEPGIVGDNYLDYTYYEMDNGNATLTGTGDLTGVVLMLNHAPVNYYYGLQVGVGANLEDAIPGLSGWFTYSDGAGGSGQGDVILEGDCIVYDCPDLSANIGDACDDGDANTEDDMVSADCVCAGTQIYDCPDLSANIGDACDDGDAGTENDAVNADCVCAGTVIYECPDLQANIGDACDDGDANTEDDLVSADCVCAGTQIYDCPDLSANIGDACDDGDADTENDMVSADCVCAGTIPTGDCLSDEQYPDADQTIGDDGSLTTITSCNFAGEYAQVILTADGDYEFTASVETSYFVLTDANNVTIATGTGSVSASLTAGTYRLHIWADDACTIGADCIVTTGQCTTCVPTFDCPDLQANFGDACDDGDDTTENDVIAADACVCAGTLIPDTPENDLCADAIAIECGAAITASTVGGTNAPDLGTCGTALDAGPGVWYSYMGTGDEVTVSTCGSTFDTKLGVFTGSCDELICEAGDDDDPNCGASGLHSTVVFTATAGTQYYLYVTGFLQNAGDFSLSLTCETVIFDCPDLQANFGDACDDGDVATTNDVITGDCVCAGTIPSGDCVSDDQYPTTDQTIADDGSLTTITSCNFAGEFAQVIVTADGDYEFTASVETSYFVLTDANNGTIATGTGSVSASLTAGTYRLHIWADDACTIGADCIVTTAQCTTCVPTFDCPDLQANFGDACDDGDDTTTNDVVSDDCVCAGTPYDCPSLLANIGDACDDDDATTENDMVSADCICAGTLIPDTPANDLCADALAMFCGATVSGTTVGATTDVDLGTCTTNLSAGPGVWYSIMGLGDDITLTSCGSDFDTKLGVFSGACDDLTCVIGNDDSPSDECTPDLNTSALTFNAAAGTQYYIYVTGFLEETGNYALSVTCADAIYDCEDLQVNFGDACDDGDVNTGNDVYTTDCICAGTPPLANDNICDAIPVTPADCDDTPTITGDNTGATASGNIGSCWFVGGAIADRFDVWYSIVVPAAGNLRIETYTNGLTDTQIALYSADGNCDGALTEVACNDDDGAGLQALIEVDGLTPGATLYLQVTGYDGSQGTFDMSVSSCGTVQFDCPDLQVNFGDACDDGDIATENDVYTADCVCAGTVPVECTATIGTLSTDNAGPNCANDGVVDISIFQVSESSATNTNILIVRPDGTIALLLLDDIGIDFEGALGDYTAYGIAYEDDLDGTALDNLTGCFALSNPIVITGLDNGEGDCPAIAAPANDDCANAIALECGVTAAGTTAGATISGLDAACAGFSSTTAEDVFYTFVADGISSYTVDVQPGADDLIDAVLFIYSGPCLTPTAVTCEDANFSDGGSSETAVLDGLAAGTYTVRIFNWNSGGAEFNVTLTCDGAGNTAPIEDGTDVRLTTYPNPSNGQSMTLDLTNLPGEGEIVNMSIVDVFGRTVNIGQFANNTRETTRLVEFNNELQDGVYHVRVDYNGVVKTVMFVVSK